MSLHRESCYRASAACDPRFDGRFFLAVATTGIYCRPVCPAPMPRLRNVRFFATAAAAESEGYRPCLRCRPESAPGLRNGTSVTVERALRLIDDGCVDRGGIESLAGRLGVGTRHLRRLFREHVGATPVAVAQTRRLHFAKKLIDETALPMTEVAVAAGFASVRRFNAAVRAMWDRSPGELRRLRGRRRPGAGSPIELRLAYRPPFDWGAILEFLAARVIPGVETVAGDRYGRTIRTGAARGRLDVGPGGERELVLSVRLDRPAPLLPLVSRVRRMFDLDADMRRIDADLRPDPALGKSVLRSPGLRLPVAWDPFELVVRAVVGQRITVRGAHTILGRIVESFGTACEVGGDDLGRLFPQPAVLAGAELERTGLTGARAATIREVAAGVRDGEIALEASEIAPALERLARIRGIGDWTLQYVALRGFGEPDAFPAGDLGLRKALGSDGAPVAIESLAERAEAWRPWRAYAAIHLWHGGAG